MAYLHLKIQEVVADTDNDNKPRVRLRFEEFKPRSGYINLKNASADQINQLQGLVGGDAMISAREGMMNGQTFFQFLHDEPIIPIHQPDKILTSKTVDFVPVVDKPTDSNQPFKKVG